MMLDDKKAVFLALLDLSAAFDFEEQTLLLLRMMSRLGIGRTWNAYMAEVISI